MKQEQNPSKCLQIRFGNDLNPMRLIFSDKNQDVEINLDPFDPLFYKSGKYIPPKKPWIPPPARTKKPTAAMARNSNHFPLNELVIGFPNGGSGPGQQGPPFTIQSGRLENFKASFYPKIQEDSSLPSANVKEQPLPPLTPGLIDAAKVLESLAETKAIKGSREKTNEFEVARRRLSKQIRTVKDQISAIQVSISNLQYQQKSNNQPEKSSTQRSKYKFPGKISDCSEFLTAVPGAEGNERKSMYDKRKSSTKGPKQEISRRFSDDGEFQTNVTEAGKYETKLMKDMKRKSENSKLPQSTTNQINVNEVEEYVKQLVNNMSKSSYEIPKNKVSGKPSDNNKIQNKISKAEEGEKIVNGIYLPAVTTTDSYTTRKCASQDRIIDSKLVEKSISQGICPVHPLVRFATCTGCQILEHLQSIDESKRRKTCPAFTGHEDSKTGPVFTKEEAPVESESNVSEESNVKKLADKMRKSKAMVDSVFEAKKSASNVQMKYIKNAEALFNEQQSIIKALCNAFNIAKKFKFLESCSSESSQKQDSFQSFQKESSSSKETNVAPSSIRVKNPQQVMATLENDISNLQSQIQMKKNELEQMMRRSSKIKKTSDSALSEELLQATAQAKVLKQGLKKVKAAKKKLESELSEQQYKINELIGQRREFSFDQKRTSSKKILDANDTAIDWDDVNSKLDRAVTDIVHEYRSCRTPEYEETSSHTTIDRSNKNFYGTAESKEKKKPRFPEEEYEFPEKEYELPKEEYELQNKETEFMNKECEFPRKESEFPKKESRFKSTCDGQQMANSMMETMKLLAPVMQEKWFKKCEICSKSSIGVDHHEERFSFSLSDRVEETPKRSKSDLGRLGRGLSSGSSLQDERTVPAKALSTVNEVYEEDSKTDELDKSEERNGERIRKSVPKEFSDDSFYDVEYYERPEYDRSRNTRFKSMPAPTVPRPVFTRAKSDAPKGFRQQQRGNNSEDRNGSKSGASSNGPFADRIEESYRIPENGKFQQVQGENNASTRPKYRSSKDYNRTDSSRRDEVEKPIPKKKFSDRRSEVERVEAEATFPDNTIEEEQSIRNDDAKYLSAPSSIEGLDKSRRKRSTVSKEFDPKKDSSFEFYVDNDKDIKNDSAKSDLSEITQYSLSDADLHPSSMTGSANNSGRSAQNRKEMTLEKASRPTESEGPPSDSFLTGSRETMSGELTQHSFSDNDISGYSRQSLENNSGSRGNKTRRKLEFSSDSNSTERVQE